MEAEVKEVKQEEKNLEEGVGVESAEKERDIVKEAREVAEELKKQNEEKAKLLQKEKELLDRKEALMQLGGSSLAGKREEKKEETPKEYKDRIMRGGV